MTENFIIKAKKIHGNKFDYSEVVYVHSKQNVTIICRKHGEFQQLPNVHLRKTGKGCRKCSNVNDAESLKAAFIKKAIAKHKGRYDYSKIDYKNNKQPIIIICQTHGEFQQSPLEHLKAKHGCGKCAKPRKAQIEVIATFKSIHKGKYDYSKVRYSRGDIKVTIVCPEHGEFQQKPATHLRGKGCKECSIDERKSSTNDFIERSNLVHQGKYDYSKTEYSTLQDELTINCPEHGNFLQKAHVHLRGSGCQKCTVNGQPSKPETELYEFIKTLDPKAIQSDRKAIAPQELDIVSSDGKFAIEFNGLHWHSRSKKGRNYHLHKTKSCENKGIRLIHIREDIWQNKKEQIKRLLTNVFSQSVKTYGRKTRCKQISKEEADSFINKIHIQGTTKATWHYGLFYEGELVSVATFCNKRGYMYKSKSDEVELVRFCSDNMTVVGGLSKLIKNFSNDYPDFKFLKSYCDLSMFTGKVYESAGFNLLRQSSPNYVYFKTGMILSRGKCQKHKLSKLLHAFNENDTEYQNMLNNGYDSIYDCGNLVFQKPL